VATIGTVRTRLGYNLVDSLSDFSSAILFGVQGVKLFFGVNGHCLSYFKRLIIDYVFAN